MLYTNVTSRRLVFLAFMVALSIAVSGCASRPSLHRTPTQVVRISQAGNAGMTRVTVITHGWPPRRGNNANIHVHVVTRTCETAPVFAQGTLERHVLIWHAPYAGCSSYSAPIAQFCPPRRICRPRCAVQQERMSRCPQNTPLLITHVRKSVIHPERAKICHCRIMPHPVKKLVIVKKRIALCPREMQTTPVKRPTIVIRKWTTTLFKSADQESTSAGEV